ncbi:MAG: cytochrome c biogenesis protein CcsA [Chloroflexi bacterium]|nr:cytochrome c biogenesis protein CcsA [Chloroflexota bacterium]
MAEAVVTKAKPRGGAGRSGLVRDILLVASALLMGLTLVLIYFWVPTEQNLGVSQRIFYFHVPVGWLGMVSIVLVAIASIMHLVTGKDKWDSLAYSTDEIGLISATLIIVTGTIWAKSVWGIWWTWDAKLTTTLVLWFIYVGYLMVRAYAPKGSQGARYGSVVALIGAVDAPIIYMATVWWRTAHPELNIGPVATDADSIGSSKIVITLLVSTLMFTILYVYMLVERYSMRRTEAELDEVHQMFV